MHWYRGMVSASVALVLLVGCSSSQSESDRASGDSATGTSQCSIPTAGANTPNLNLQGCRLAGRNLSGAGLAGSDLSGADLSGTNLTGADLSRTQIIDANTAGTVLVRANLSGATIAAALGASLDRVNLEQSDLRSATFYNPRFVGSNLRGARVGPKTFTDATWTDTVCPDGYRTTRPPDSCAGHY